MLSKTVLPYLRKLDLFVNYVHNPTRRSPLNLAVARVVFGLVFLWKFTTAVNWSNVAEWPVYINQDHRFLVFSDLMLEYLWVEKWLCIFCLIGFTLGYRTNVTGFFSALLLAHMSGILWMVHNSGLTQMFLPATYFLLFFAVYHSQDRLSIDEVRRTGQRSLRELNEFLKDGTPGNYRADALRWMLLTVGLVYFGTGYAKILDSGTDWMTASNLIRKLKFKQIEVSRDFPVGDVIISEPILAFFGSFFTVVSEVGVLVAIVLGVSFTPFVVFLLMMHVLIALTYSPHFYELYFAWALFVPWDDLYSKIAATDRLELVYDENCYFCARSMVLVRLLDINDTLVFYSQSDLPDRLDREEYDYSEAMYAFKDGKAYRGYYAFQELMVHFRILLPLGWVMRHPTVETIGTRVYQYVAANRDRHFTCKIQKE